MNILIIGNGFDLAHGLPTKYGDFLDFCEKLKKIYTKSSNTSFEEFKKNEIDNWEICDDIKYVLIEAYANIDSVKNNGKLNAKLNYLKGIVNLILKNAWFEFFLSHRATIGENWIDFEKEISVVIQSLDEALTIMKKGKNINEISNDKSQILIDICKAASKSMQEIYCDYNAVIEFTIFLETELKKLIRALEIYIVVVINNIDIADKNDDINNLEIDFVLSFNYSNTYERLYCQGKKTECDYIHGKAEISKNINTCNLVLGINEFLDDDRKNIDLQLLSFKKFYQRIYKATGNLYLDWVDIIKEGFIDTTSEFYLLNSHKHPSHTLYIFGHSLDTTDKDILKLFICNDNVQTKIFYHQKNQDDKTQLGKLIRNLILIMGQEELIKRTGGIHKTIEFIPQSIEPKKS